MWMRMRCQYTILLLLQIVSAYNSSVSAISSSASSSTSATRTDSWSFLVFADWHGAESFATNPVDETRRNNTYYDETLLVLQNISSTYQGELIVLPGDSNNGKWHTDSFRRALNDNLGLQLETADEAIALGGRNCYSTVKRLFQEAGYPNVIMAVGDHELGTRHVIYYSLVVTHYCILFILSVLKCYETIYSSISQLIITNANYHTAFI